ncbi:unnamed protein product [Allacma fusca]|uniref:Transposase n=1 Tax=Allacma fusca TaxID=39272 RepID=A0A8J2PS18_9HEXA|nr:unnamed protein product [Allacma fusca]
MRRPRLDGVFAAVVRWCLLKLGDAFADYASTARLPKRSMLGLIVFRILQQEWLTNDAARRRANKQLSERKRTGGKNHKHRGRIKMFNRAVLTLINYTSRPSTSSQS